MKCKSCGKEIVFLLTMAGKSIPVDKETVKVTGEIFSPDRHTTHFATCPNANTHRKARKNG